MHFLLERNWWRQGAIVTLSLACSSLLALAFKPILHDKAQLFPFTLAVIVASAYGGLVAGLVTTVSGFFIADYFFIEPVFQTLSVPGDYGLLLVFLIFGTSLSVLNHALAKANRAVLERSRQLAQSNEELQRFASAVAHDLKEPLRGIRMFTDLFLSRNRGQFDDESTLWLDFVSSGADRMKRLIDAILEFSAAGRASSVCETDAGAVVRSAVEDLKSAVEEAHAEVHVGPLPPVLADERQLGRLFVNLIGNAIKHHGGEKRPLITISAQPAGSNWVFSVKDNGAGIDPQYHNRVFETFQRVHRRVGGQGLGLAICNRIVEQLGGRIWVESQPGKGADFRFTLPGARH